MPHRTRIQVLSPIIKNRKGNHQKVLEDIRKAGFARARVDGEVRELDEDIELGRYEIHNIEIVVDRLIIRQYDDPQSDEAQSAESRLTDAIETALEHGDGTVIINNLSEVPPFDVLYSEHFACPNGHGSLPELEPRLFSFNTPKGACPDCQGLGFRLELDPTLVVPNPDLSITDGCIDANGWNLEDGSWNRAILDSISDKYNVPLDKPWSDLTKNQQDVILHGTGTKKIKITYTNRYGNERTYDTTFEGVVTNLMRRYEETSSDYIRDKIESYMSQIPCKTCSGRRLRPEALAVTVSDRDIHSLTDVPVGDLYGWVSDLQSAEHALTERDREISYQILKEIEARLRFLNDVGIGYLTLSRTAGTLSGGEAQRIRLATQIGSRLTGVLYVLDEPSIGLHQRDNARLIQTLSDLRDLGNTVLVVEHDEDTMRAADHLIDLGPGAGEHGGQIVAQGTPDEVEDVIGSPTGDYLSGRFSIPLPDMRRDGTGHSVTIRGARENNLKDINVDVPLWQICLYYRGERQRKSTLLVDILHKRLAQVINGSRERPGEHDEVLGIEQLDKIINIDQSPIGRTPRSNPGTYTKMFDAIRSLFTDLPESKIRGYSAGRFSFNVKGGRCENW